LTQPPVTAVILDMDGLLIDTEPTWRAAAFTVLAALGVRLSDDDLLSTTGQPIGDLVPLWRRRAGPDGRRAQPSDAEVADLITDQVVAHVSAEGQPMPGVAEAVALCTRLGLSLAIASSSPRRLIDAVCDRLGLGGIQVRCSAADEANGKPAPDVYLAAARRLGVPPAGCVAIEDSPNGIAAAKAAGMRCVAVPDPLLQADPAYQRADLVLPSLAMLDERALRLLGVRAHAPRRVPGP
jgi:mannitol-1-/sugar-/sorbitol-6-/2-deoxyglucose-6-phosphatase